MARFSTVNTLTPLQSVPAPAVSNSIRVSAARDARVFIEATAVDPGASMAVEVQVSPDNATFYTVRSFNDITAAGNYMLALEEFLISGWLRLKYTPAVGATTLEATLEHKQGV